MLRFSDLALGKGPGVLEVLDNFDKRFIVLQLWIDQFNIVLIVPNQHSIRHKGLYHTLSKLLDGERVAFHSLLRQQALGLEQQC